MSTKVIYTLKEDKQEIQKQFGCMNGIFQLFDRRYLLGQRHRGHNQKQLPQGESENGNKRFNNASEKAKEKTTNNGVKEKHRVSVESSRNSFSSSCSSLDCSKRVQTEQSSFCPSMVSESSTPTSHRIQPDVSVQPADIRDVVKDSMTRKPRVVPVKTVAKDGRKGPAMTHVDSPRPLLHSKPVSYDRKDQNLAKLREISRGVREVKETSRFSCDGRESPYKLKSISKELPRLSLDSRQSSIRNRTNESLEPGSNKRPSSSVVARLMGLEVLNDFINGGETLKIKPSLDDKSISLSRNGEESTPNNISVKLTSPQRGIGNAMTRVPLEPAPWKQEGGSRGTQKQPAKNKKAPEKTDHACHSVYGEIEKRLTEVEFKTSGKDLRALKQILEAIQRTKMRLEKTDQDSDDSSSDQRQNQKSVQPVSPAIKGTNSPKKQEIRSPATKPANLTSDSMVITGLQKVKKDNHTSGRKYMVGRRSTRNTTPMETQGNGRTTKSTSPSKAPEYLTAQNYCNSRNSGTVSPRLQRSKKQSICGPSSDLSGIRQQSNGKLTVSDSNTRNSKTRSINPQQASDKRNLSQQGDTVSFSSESNTSVASQNEPEVMSTDWTRENNGIYQPRENHKNKFAERLIEYKPMAELAMLTMEQPSPVSVLDAFYTEDTPSPIQKKSYAFKDDDDLRFDEPEWNQVGVDNLVSSREQDQASSGFDHVNIENIKHLVHQIELLNSSSDEATIEHTADDSINGDHRYIKEILLASGFLKNLDCATTIVHLHPTGSLINPELFDILEKTKECSEKIRRKMIFDTVNSILIQKLARSASSGVWTSKRKGRILDGEKLLEELWSEINNLQTDAVSGLYDEIINIITADVNKRPEDWDDNCNEVPALVLDIERLIFKDLISEIVNAEVAGPGRHCRQLFLV